MRLPSRWGTTDALPHSAGGRKDSGALKVGVVCLIKSDTHTPSKAAAPPGERAPESLPYVCAGALYENVHSSLVCSNKNLETMQSICSSK